MRDVVRRLNTVKDAIHGCESLSVTSIDGFVLASTHDELKKGEELAAITSVVLPSCSRGLAPLGAGQCRALDFRGDRQVLITRLQDLAAYLVCVLHPGASAVNIDEPSLRQVISILPDVLRGSEPKLAGQFFLQRDASCLIPLRRGFLVGAGDHCDLVVPHDDVDSEHLRFEILGNQLMVRDLATRHGTKLNMRNFNGTRDLDPGDRISLPGAGGFTVVAFTASGELLDGTDRSKKKKTRRRRRRKKTKKA